VLSFNDGNFGVVINLLKSQGAVHVLSSPRIATINNQKAVLRVGTDDFFVTEVTVGTAATLTTPATPSTVTVEHSFRVLRWMSPHKSMTRTTLRCTSARQSARLWKRVNRQFGGAGGVLVLPLASSTISETDSVVRLKDGQIVAIGGLMSQLNDDSDNRVPLLGDIPYFGQLFGNTSRASRKREMWC